MFRSNDWLINGRFPVKLPFIFFCALLFSPLCSQATVTVSSEIQQQRLLFKQAENTLATGNSELFSQLLIELRDYPAVAYLEHDALRNRLDSATGVEVKAFFDKYEGYPFRYPLLSKYLDILAKRKDWQGYLAFYDDRSAVKYKCLALSARLELGQSRQINKEIEPLWMTGYSQPDECDTPFQYFLDTSEHPSVSIWLRIEKAFAARRPALAKYLAKKLDDEDRALVDQWYQAHRKPARHLPVLERSTDSLINRKIIVHALLRLARKDSLQAKEFWDRMQNEFQFSPQQVKEVNKRIALSAAYQHKPESKQLLEQLPAELKTDNAHLWLARIHLRDEDWIGLIKTIDTMPDHLKKEAEWRYWLARSYELSGHAVKAADIYSGLSDKSTYYGFLAADRIDREYQIKSQKAAVESSFDENDLLARNDHLLRARELFFLDRLLDARREWFQGIRKLNQQEVKQAASIASSWKWHDNAIKTVAKTPHRSDYDLRFPMPYRQTVMTNAQLLDLDPSIIYGVMRRESLFDPLAKSRVGALGLMQLMPATARGVARTLGLKRPKQSDIMEVDNNIRLGTQYFKTVLGRFDNNVSLAAAAYNAGPSNVKKWLPKSEALAADLWVETVPFTETRNYIQAVLAYATIFDNQLDKRVSLSSRMVDVKSSY